VNLSSWMLRNLPTRPLKRLIFSWVRRRQFCYETTTFRGWRLHGNTTDRIQRDLYYFGLWEPSLTAWIERRLSHGDVFVDVGANVGYFTLLAAKCVGTTGKVVAIEPQPEIFQHLSAHVTANALQNVRLVNEAAVGPDEAGTVTLYWGGDANIGSTSMLSHGEQSRSTTAAARPLASILTDDECRRARIIKIDVEGVEAKAVRGLCLESGRFRDDLELAVEVSDAPNDQSQRMHFLRYMEDLGFHAYISRDSNDGFRDLAVKSATRLPPIRLTTPNMLLHLENIIFSRIDGETLSCSPRAP
jgi:FkbM family methyltransferase